MRFGGLGFVGAALAVHLAIPGLARIAPRWEPPMLARSSGAGRIQAIDVEVAEPPPPDPEPRLAAIDTKRLRDPLEPSRSLEPRSGIPSGSPSAEPSATPSAAPSVAPAGPSDGFDKPPDDPNGGLAGTPGARPVYGMAGVLPDHAAAPAPAPTTAGPQPEVDRKMAGKVLGALMDAKDHALGLELPGVGTVASRIAEAVRASDAPAVARSTFQVRLSASGQVTSVHAVSWTAGTPDVWQHASNEATSRFAGFTLSMTGAYAGGAIVTVQVISSLTLPSGSTAPGQHPSGNEPSNSGPGFKFDLSDVGAKPRRVVKSSYQVSPAS